MKEDPKTRRFRLLLVGYAIGAIFVSLLVAGPGGHVGAFALLAGEMTASRGLVVDLLRP
jgi:hypothetical protein